MTRHALAGLAACADITIEKIEIGERRPSVEVAQSLAGALRIPSAEREVFIAFARGTPPPDASDPRLRLIPNNLPASLPTLIGREQDVESISRQLAHGGNRLLTLTGPGGVGKTALALHIAERLAQCAVSAELPPFQNGILFVDLSALRDPDRVVPAISNALDSLQDDRTIATSEVTLSSLKARLKDQSMLIVLDNFEQVLPAARWVHSLLAECKTISALVVSRECLHAQDERVVSVTPLSQSSAVSLFILRAQAVNPRFNPAGDSLRAIEWICRRLDGLPLAIELVAARVKLMSPQALLERLADERLHLGLIAGDAFDVPARQRDLRETIAWSYRLLTRDEQRVFRLLSLFAGGCDLKCVEQVASGECHTTKSDRATVSTWDALTSLLDKSLLTQTEDESGEARFIMLETIREYALERLHAEADSGAAQRHAGCYFALALEAEPHLLQSRPVHWLRRLDQEHGNLRASLEWHVRHDAPAALRMCAALGAMWHITGAWREGRQWLEAALAKTTHCDAARASALYWLGRIARMLSDPKAALRHGEASVALYQALGDAGGVARATMSLGWARYSSQGCAAATPCFEQGLAMYRTLGDTRGIAQALLDLSHMAREQDADHERATRYLKESRMLFRLLGDDEGQGYVLWGLAEIASQQGNYAQCRELTLDALEVFKRIGAKGVLANGYEYLGEASYLMGDAIAADEALTTALDLHREAGSTSGAAMTQHHLAHVRRQQRRLDEATILLREALAMFCRRRNEGMMARCIAALGGIALERKRLARAAALLSAAQHCFDNQPPFLSPADKAEYARDIAACCAGMGEQAFGEAWAAGRVMTLDEACELALAL
jgi:predicted ATPase